MHGLLTRRVSFYSNYIVSNIVFISHLMIVSLTIFDLFLAAAQDSQQKVMLEVAPWPRPGYGWTNSGISLFYNSM